MSSPDATGYSEEDKTGILTAISGRSFSNPSQMVWAVKVIKALKEREK